LKIKFEKAFQIAYLLTPSTFQEFSQEIEVRKDPLTEKTCRINVNRAKRPKQSSSSLNELNKFIQESKANCFFCPENIEKLTPSFSGDLPKKIKVGEAVVFPNLYPYAAFHVVGVFSNAHYLELNQFDSKLIENCFKACLKYFNLIHKRSSEAKYWYIGWNYMPSGAASVIHPHIQALADSKPTTHLKELIELSRIYYEKNKSNYWLDLIEIEKELKDRFIGAVGSINLLASFAPQGNKEVLIISSRKSSLSQFTDLELTELCESLSKVLKGFYSIGVKSFTISTFSGPCNEDCSRFYLFNLKFVSRPIPTPFYTNDDGFMEKLHQEPIVDTLPEDLANELKRFF
jgi:galactose-1-phosphate uridylyltransferase